MIGWVVSVAGLALILFGWYPTYSQTNIMSRTTNILYLASSRVIWCVCVAFIIYACQTSNGGIVNKFLSSDLWVPFSRMSYSTYLSHAVIFDYFRYVQERPLHAQLINVLYLFCGNIIFSHILSFFVHILFETPIVGLEKYIFPKH